MEEIMKKLISLLLCALFVLSSAVIFSGCGAEETLIVQTNAYFAPFEYYEGTTITGVDVEIMEKVAEKLGMKLEFVNVEFAAIIDNVAAGKICDAGAAGITVTDARLEKVDFSNTYFTSVQYVVYKNGALTPAGKTADGDDYVTWDQLAGLKIGVQQDTTGDFYVSDEIAAKEGEDGYDWTGVLNGSGAEVARFDSAQLAVDAISANTCDVAVCDMLPAEYIVGKNTQYSCAALYYKGGEGEADSPTAEDYAICVTKGNKELLDAINAVLAELGSEGVTNLVKKHMGITD